MPSSSFCLRLVAPRQLEIHPWLRPEPLAGSVILKVEACGICRTDAKMWAQGEAGQPDLRLPRVLGHEMVCCDEATGERFVVWPAEACGCCPACASGAENLCPTVRILGFHVDGGFATHVQLPRSSLFFIPAELSAVVATLAEPLACACRAWSLARLLPSEEVLIVGGGTLGALLAIAAQACGAKVTVQEIQPEKCIRLQEILGPEVLVRASAAGSQFDVVVTAAATGAAFCEGLAATKARGRILFFSGLGRDVSIPASLLNFTHYRELTLQGVYGCTRADMAAAIDILSKDFKRCDGLVDQVVSLSEVPQVIDRVLEGRGFRVVMSELFA